MWYLGWDCANRTLAFVLMKIDMNELAACERDINTVTTFEQLNALRARVRNIIEIRHARVVDLLENNIGTYTRVQLARKLGEFLDNSEVSAARIRDLHPQVIIEYQPPKLARWGGATTEQASTVAHQLMFYYREFDANYIDSKEKNKVAARPDLTFERYLAGCDTESRRKSARKKHTSDNFTLILSSYNCAGVAAIKKSLLNHAADACLQIIAFVKKNP